MNDDTIEKYSKEKCLVNWYTKQNEDYDEFLEFYSYLQSYPESMFNLALFLEWYKLPSTKINDYSSKGRMIFVLENINNFFVQLEKENPEKLSIIRKNFYEKYSEKNKVKKM